MTCGMRLARCVAVIAEPPSLRAQPSNDGLERHGFRLLLTKTLFGFRLNETARPASPLTGITPRHHRRPRLSNALLLARGGNRLEILDDVVAGDLCRAHRWRAA